NWPSAGPDSIIFENAGYLYTLDLNGGQPKKLSIYLPGDRDFVRKHWDNVSKLTTAFDLSPDGKRAVFNSRGNLYTVPAKEGSIRALTQTPGVRELYSAWSPDGKWIAYISDRSGEDEFYVIPQDGMGKEIRITTDGKVFRLQPVWSPDSTKLLFADKSLRLFYVDINEKKPVLVDQGKYADLTDYSWSPDSRWVAYAKTAENLFGVIDLYSLADKKITPVTSSFTTSSNPVFDQNGKYLYFLSARDYNEVIGAFDFEVALPKPVRVYAVTLRADLASPFAPQSDEVSVKKPDVEAQAAADQKKDEKKDAKKDEKSAGKDDSKEKPEPFHIDLAGIAGRVVGLPITPGNLGGLLAAKDAVYYVSQPVTGLSGPLPGENPTLHIFDMKERKDHALFSPLNGYALSYDGKKLLYAAPREGASDDDQGGNTAYGIVDATVPSDGPHKVGEGALDLSSMRAEIDPPAEWKQMLYEVYRQERDYFFEAAMNGVNWEAQRDKYAQLLPYVADRYDLTYILGEFIGELSNSHTYNGGGDSPNLKPVNTGFLGVDYELDSSSGRYRIKKIYPGENWNDALRSPLTEPGVDVKPGDYLLAVNGRELRAPQSPYEWFTNTAGQNVTLTVNSKPAEEGSRRVVVKPIASEFKLHELDWIETNRRKVDEATKGRVGYVYLPDMEDVGLNEFFKQWFPQVRKEGMIIDVRYNGGGFVDQIIFERLRRIVLGMGTARNFESTPNPDPAFFGSMACVTNEYAASDGDFFTYYFKLYKLGPVIGMRTWGGVRGIRGNIPLIDGGYVTRPEFSLYDMNSQWVIENKGVQPDIVIDNTPDQVMAGHDPQLEKAIDVVLKQIQEHPRTLPPRPPDLPAYPTKPGQ
ncbi:MAG: S41 family peptidase, partial [Candidatus Acidiferrales bacterium]